MDDKIKEKARKHEERDLLSQVEKETKNVKKRKAKEVKEESVKQSKKKQKQKEKDDKKKERKKQKASVKSSKCGRRFIISNIKDIPDNCKHLVKQGDVLYVVPGDGCCGPNCAAAFLFSDEVFRPKLRKRMNAFFVKHWYTRYQNISQCSEGHPFKRNVKGGEVQFTDPKKLLKFLKNSPKAAFMWSDSEDLAIIADMFQLKIKVLTTKGLDDMEPTVNYIYPEPSLKQYAELNVELNEMVLLHENDSHFNLVISEESDLARFGSLSQRFGQDPVEEDNETYKDVTKEDENKQNDTEFSNLKQELKKCQESKDYIEKEYFKCEKELRMKTEEVEKVKIEVKDLRKIINLKNKLEENGLDEPKNNENNVNSFDEVSDLHKMKSRGFKRNNPQSEPSKTNDKNKGEESEIKFDCNKCDFIGVNEEQLRIHFRFKHNVQESRKKN